MHVWEGSAGHRSRPAIRRDARLHADLWRAADKVVYSSTLDRAVHERGRNSCATFDTDAVRAMKQGTDRDLSVGGPGLTAHTFAAGLVDEVALFLNPIVVGAGTPALPAGLVVHLDLVEHHRFANGVVYVQYRVRPDGAAPCQSPLRAMNAIAVSRPRANRRRW